MGHLVVFDYGEKIFLSAHRDDDNEEEERVKKNCNKNCVNILIYIVHVRFVTLSGVDSFYRTTCELLRGILIRKSSLLLNRRIPLKLSQLYRNLRVNLVKS